MGKTSGTEREELGASQLRGPRSGDRSKSRWSEPPLRFQTLANGEGEQNFAKGNGALFEAWRRPGGNQRRLCRIGVTMR